MTQDSALSTIRVLEISSRIAAAVCGGLLRDAGAHVTVAATGSEPGGKSLDKPVYRHDKQIEEDAYAEADAQRLTRAACDADIVIFSSDIEASWVRIAIAHARLASDQLIVIDLTATGSFGPLSGQRMSDLQLQAICGLIDTTGAKDEAPVAIGFPFVEVVSGIQAANGALAALHARDRNGEGQMVDVALYDCAINALTTFLPKAFAGGAPSRIGNRHPLAAPWNAFPTADGWILMCTSSEEQWVRLAKVIDATLLNDARFTTLNDRVAHVDALDDMVSAWSKTFTTAQCQDMCDAADIPAGPIRTVDDLMSEPNVLHRAVIHANGDARDQNNWVPGVPYKLTARPANNDAAAKTGTSVIAKGQRALPLAGVKVVEVGQYTTAPLAAKQLAALGAQVIKVEPLAGDASRAWRPGQGDVGYFFALSNTDKLGVALNFKENEGIARFKTLLSNADVLVENMRPGVLQRVVGGEAALHALNPGLIHCAISGFGVDSAYPKRPAFDTVAQAMSGFMDLTRRFGVPMKAGISGADILGGQISTFAILCALRNKSRHGDAGALIDVAMQDVGVWATHPVWGQDRTAMTCLTICCADGALLAEGVPAALSVWLKTHQFMEEGGAVQSTFSRKEIQAAMAAPDVQFAEVKSIADVLKDDHFKVRCLNVGRDGEGRYWPTINAPYRLQKTPAISEKIPGKPGEDNEKVFGPAQ